MFKYRDTKKENYSMRAIAKHLNRSVSTVFREIKCRITIAVIKDSHAIKILKHNSLLIFYS
ncbi:helix-turn-helix domain-containing protein [Staphylococcus pettenkoferi]|uniref:helix-turn-helix domain-containing protein n=1 Tax=Staphylococcus pettenkoferi TaxID=170573 RepID=UPI00344C5A00